MPDIFDPAIEAYAESHITAPPEILASVASATRASLHVPGMTVGRMEGRFLDLLVFATWATSVLESGTFSGCPALAMAAGLVSGGSIVTCEIDPVHEEIAQRHIASSPYADRVEIMLGLALDTTALREFNDTVATDPRVVAVQTTFRDGVTMIRRVG
ncbi:MAG: O-methyltransferase [Acidimicrobiales bacterium]